MHSWYSFSKKNDVDDDAKFQSIVKFITAIWTLPNIELLCSKAKDSFSPKKDHICKVKLADYEDGVVIYLVNGDEIKIKLYMDFVEGGHDIVYGEKASDPERDFMPPKEVWIDANVDTNSMPYILTHELFERYRMEEKNEEYEDAHDYSNKLEKNLRQKRFFDNKRKILDFPPARQADGNTCGHYSLMSVLRFYGEDVILKEVLGFFTEEENKMGLAPQQIVKAAAKFGHKAEIRTNFTVEKIKECIKKDIPVLVGLQAWPENEDKDLSEAWDEGHWAVAIGFTEKYVIFSDSSVFGKDFLSYKELEERWHDIDYGKKHTNLVVLVHGKQEFNEESIEEME
jgi:predicted double-glycine peptidase